MIKINDYKSFKRPSSKEHNLRLHHSSKYLAGTPLLAFVLFYFLMVNILIESNNQGNLVITQQPRYVDSIDDLYERFDLMPHFVKGHHVIEHFKTSINKKANEIYRRATSCKLCINDHDQYLSKIHHETTLEERAYFDTHLVVVEEIAQVRTIAMEPIDFRLIFSSNSPLIDLSQEDRL